MTKLPLEARQELLQAKVLPKLSEPVRYPGVLNASLPDLIKSVKMKDSQWLTPELVGQFEFLEWTPENHLRHTRFVGLREDKQPRKVMRE